MPRVSDAPDGLIGGNETRRRLGHISGAMLTYLAKTNQLVPVQTNDQGWKYYDPEEVDRFAVTYKRAQRGRNSPNLVRQPNRQETLKIIGYKARKAAEVAVCLKRGMSLTDIVIECEVTPQFAREVYRELSMPLPAGEEARVSAQQERDNNRNERERERRERQEEIGRVRRREIEVREKAVKLLAKKINQDQPVSEEELAAVVLAPKVAL